MVGAVRERLPRRRTSSTFAFRVADCEGYVTVGEYEDGRPGEVFMKVSKQGSTLAGIMDAFSISVSLGLQHGVPLATYVRKYTNMRFEPAGITDDPDLRIATSLVDYIFRRLAVDYLPLDERAELGVLSTAERMQPTLPGVEETATDVGRGGRGRGRRPGDHHGPGREWRWPCPAGRVRCRRTARRWRGPAVGGRGHPGTGDAAGCPGSVRPSRWPGPSHAMPPTATSAATPCSGPGRATCARAAAPPAAARDLIRSAGGPQGRITGRSTGLGCRSCPCRGPVDSEIRPGLGIFSDPPGPRLSGLLSRG